MQKIPRPIPETSEKQGLAYIGCRLKWVWSDRLVGLRMGKKQILTNVWCAQHPKADQNMQQLFKNLART